MGALLVQGLSTMLSAGVLIGLVITASAAPSKGFLAPSTTPAFTILPDEAGVIDDITRKRAEPQWTPLTELLTGEYQCAEVPIGMFKSSHGDFARGHMVRILNLKFRAELNGSLGKLVRYD